MWQQQYDYIKLAEGKLLKANEDNVLDGHLNMQQHKKINLADPVNSYKAVNLRYVSSRIQALTDENRQQNDLINIDQGMISAALEILADIAPHQDDPEV